MAFILRYLFAGCLLISFKLSPAQHSPSSAVSELIGRVLPNHRDQITTEIIPGDKHNADVFEIESVGKEIVLRGNNAVSIASALNWYLKYYCHVQDSWCGTNMALPAKLPSVNGGKVRIVSPYQRRVYFNYCTFNYSMTWWDWERWEREIDWMAMHGVNMPLAVTGQEAVWQNTLRRYNMTNQEIRQFLVGPAYAAWQWMTNIESIFGPLPQSWIDRSVELQKKILKRQRELGMTPILQGFTGYVPLKLIEKQPQANILKKPVWFYVGEGTAQLDPLDPLFSKMNQTFIEEQTKLFGTSHWYAADPFHEGEPPQKGDEYLAQVGKAIAQSTLAADPDAKIAMQTWSMREAIVKAIPEDRVLMLDLNSSKWSRSNSFWGRPWIAGIIHNFGGNTLMGGDLDGILGRFPAIRNNQAAGNLQGIGLFPEAIGHNPIVYEAATEMAWRGEKPDLKGWTHDYLKARYGIVDQNTGKAWDTLLATNYGKRVGVEPFMESAICSRPALKINGASPNGRLNSSRNYAFKSLWRALYLLLEASEPIRKTDTYCYDLVDLARQCMADLSIQLQQEMADAYRGGQVTAFKKSSGELMELIGDFDALLGTRKEFLLGKWIQDARKIGKTEVEKDLYEKNARSLITIYGPYHPNAIQYDYAAKQWNGLVGDFYRQRWGLFIRFLEQEIVKDDRTRYKEDGINHQYSRPANEANDFYKVLSAWEVKWSESKNGKFLVVPKGNEYEVVRKLYHKWVSRVS